MLVRTWNLFHGNSMPPGRDAHLEEMVRLAARSTDVVVLQEVPAWALAHLGDWSGMQAVGEVAQPPRFGPLPGSVEVGRMLTELHNGLLRSAVCGQANAILLRKDARVLERRRIVLNRRSFRHQQARWLGLAPVARLAWAKERRVALAVRAEVDGRPLLVTGLHATSYPADKRLADAELLRAAAFATELSRPGEVTVLAGDFNVHPEESRTLADLTGDDWGFSAPGPGIDHVLVRGADSRPEEKWPPDRREVAGLLLSDHAPVDVEIPA